MEGKRDRIMSSLPQQPKGTSEKNEKKELNAVLPVPPLKILFLLFMLQPKPLLYVDINICEPIPMPSTNIIIEFTLNAAFIASTPVRLGVVKTTTSKYIIIVKLPITKPLIKDLLAL